MAGRGGIYKGPDGDDLHGDGTPVERSSGTISSGMVMQLQWEGEKAIAELARLTALLEDQQALAKIVRDGIDFWKIHEPAESLDAFVADRIRVYLKGVKS